MAGNLDFLYAGPTELRLDEYLPQPEPYEHGASFCAGRILRKAPERLDSELWECRMPARFYKAYLSEAGGRCLGVLSTGSGVGVANVLSELCHALADGRAKLNRYEASAQSIPVSADYWLDLEDSGLWSQAAECWRQGALKLEEPDSLR